MKIAIVIRRCIRKRIIDKDFFLHGLGTLHGIIVTVTTFGKDDINNFLIG